MEVFNNRTRASLLARLADPDPTNQDKAWIEFRRLYGPPIRKWADKLVGYENSKELEQLVVERLHEQISKNWRYDPELRFRGYLRKIVYSAAYEYWDRRISADAAPASILRGLDLGSVTDANLADLSTDSGLQLFILEFEGVLRDAGIERDLACFISTQTGYELRRRISASIRRNRPLTADKIRLIAIRLIPNDVSCVEESIVGDHRTLCGEIIQIRNEESAFVRSAVGQLCDADQRILTAYFFDGMRVREIAEYMNLPANTVSQRIKRAKKKLATLIRKGRSYGWEP